MRRSVLLFICAKFRLYLGQPTRGAGALVVVLAVTLIMLMVGLTLTGRARQEMRMSAAATSADQVQLLIKGSFEEAAVRALDPTWPAPADVTESCLPQPAYPGALHPWVCLDVMPRQNGVVQGVTPPPTPPNSDTRTKYDEIPIRVKWQVRENGDVQLVYGWIMIDTSGRIAVRYNLAPCEFDPVNYGKKRGTCLQGS